MNLILLLATALGLAMDAFAVSIGVCLAQIRLAPGQVLRLALFFGLFQAGMPILGWLAGRGVSGLIQGIDHWVAFGLLMLIGGRMIGESFARDREGKQGVDRTRGWMLLVLSVATSIDAFAVGLSLGTLDVLIWFPAAVIGAVAFLMTVLGASLGPLLGRVAGRRAELAGGLLLIGIGVKILTDHLHP
jgi:putative Mn2+ efflux pump MntP